MQRDILKDYLESDCSVKHSPPRIVRFKLPVDLVEEAFNHKLIQDYGASCSPHADYYGRTMQGSSMVHEWSSPLKKTVSGLPPDPNASNTQTRRSEVRQSDVRVVTPFYKSTTPLSPIPNGKIKSESDIGRPTTKNMNGSNGLYKVEQQQEHYRLHVIDPKVESHANIPVSSTLPSGFRRKVGDFPSAHSKRSFLKLSPMEQRRLRSVEVRPITTTDYLSESLKRHREMVTSPLKDNLKLNERDVNKMWEKPDRPGHKPGELNGMLYKRTEEIRSQKGAGSYDPDGYVPLMGSGGEDTNSSFTTVPYATQALVATADFMGGKIVRQPSVKALQDAYLGEVADQQRPMASSDEIERVLVEHNLRVKSSRASSPSPPRMRHTPPPADPRNNSYAVNHRGLTLPQSSSAGLPRVSPIPRASPRSPRELSVRQRALRYEQLIERHQRSRSAESHTTHSRATSPYPTPARGHSAPPALRQPQPTPQNPSSLHKIDRQYSLKSSDPRPLPAHVFDELRSRDWYSRYMREGRGVRRVPRSSSENALHEPPEQASAPYIIYGNTRDAHGSRTGYYDPGYDQFQPSSQSQHISRASAPSFRQQPPVKRKILQKQFSSTTVGNDRRPRSWYGSNGSSQLQQQSTSTASRPRPASYHEHYYTSPAPVLPSLASSAVHQRWSSYPDDPTVSAVAGYKDRLLGRAVSGRMNSEPQPDRAGGLTVALYDSPPSGVSEGQQQQYVHFDELQLDDGLQILRYGGVKESGSMHSQQQSAYSTLERSYAQQQQQDRRQQTVISSGNRQSNYQRGGEMYRSQELHNSHTADESYSGVGRYTQMTMPPEPAVVENAPIKRNVDARPGSVTDFIQTDVRSMRQLYLDDKNQPNRAYTPSQINQERQAQQQTDRRAVSPSYAHNRPLSPATKARMRQNDPQLTEDMLRQIQMERERTRPTSTLPYMEMGTSFVPSRPSSTLPFVNDKPVRPVERARSVRVNGHHHQHDLQQRRLPARSASLRHPPPQPQPQQNGLPSWEPLHRGSPYVGGGSSTLPAIKFDPMIQYKEEKEVEERLRERRMAEMQYEQRQQALLDQYQREDRARQDRKLREQEEYLLRKRREEELNRSFWENERRQHVLKQQEVQGHAVQSSSVDLRQKSSALQTYLQGVPAAPPPPPAPPSAPPPTFQQKPQPNQYQSHYDQQQVQHQYQQNHHHQQSAQYQSEQNLTTEQQQQQGGTWKRTYQVASHAQDVIKNKIKSSEEILEEEAYYVDLLARRDAFIEKPEEAPNILRLNKVWQPPPDKPYQLPQPKPSKTFYEEEDDKRHYWEPSLTDPDFKYERKNFTPEPSPPPRRRSMRGSTQNLAAPQARHEPQRGGGYHHHQQQQQGGADSLDVRMRVIRPSSVTPSEASSAALLYGHDARRVESMPVDINVPSGHIANEPTARYKQHPSTFTGTDRPLNVNIRGRMAAFEQSQRSPAGRMGSLSRPSAPSSISLDEEMFAADARAVRFADRSGLVRWTRQWRSEMDLCKSGEIPTVSVSPQRNDDLNSLTALREELAARAKDRADYKLTLADIHKMNELKESTNRDSFVESTTTTSSTQMQKLSSAGDATDSTTWQFSEHSFSPRSVISVNGHKDDQGLLHVRTDLGSPQNTINTNAAVQTNQWRYNSMPMLDVDQEDRQSTLIKIQDDRHKTPPPRSIMKQSQAWQVEKEAARRPVENIQKVEETTRTEEIERRVIKKERRSKSKQEHKKHRRSEGGQHHYSYGHLDEGPWTAPFGFVGASTGGLVSSLTDQLISQTKESQKREWQQSVKQDQQHVSSSEQNGSVHKANGTAHKENGTVSFGNGAVVQTGTAGIATAVPLETKAENFESTEGYTDDGAYFTSQSQHSSWRRPAITSNGHGHGYGPASDEQYQRQTTTRRVREGSSSRGSRQPSVTDSLRRKDFKYSENGDIRPRHHGTGSSRVHKSHSSRDVYHNGHGDDYYWDGGYYGTGPIVEYPPTLPRDPTYGSVARNSMHKSRSFADWEDPRWRDAQMVRKWDTDMTQLERDFRDSLLMPMPGAGQNMDQREFRQENLPDGGHETLSKEVKANTGRRYDPRNVTDFSEAKQEYHYKKEKGMDRRR